MILGARSHTVSRVAAGTHSLTTGAFTDGATSTFSVIGSWQPISGREQERLPEGYRTRQAAKLFCDAAQPELYPVRVGSAQRADIITRGTARYIVVGSEDWTDHAGSTAHRLYMLAELGADEEVRP